MSEALEQIEILDEKLTQATMEVKAARKTVKKAQRSEARLRDSMAQTNMVSRRHANLMSRAIADLRLENSRRLESEAQARAAEKDAEEAAKAKGDFLANMSHELRTPMNGVLGMIQLCLMSVSDSEVHENLQVAWQSANDLLSLLNDILDFSKIEARQMTVEMVEVDPWNAVDDTIAVLAPLAAKKSIPIYFFGGSTAPNKVTTDPVRFRQVLKNLISNAIKFTHRGQIHVIASYVESEARLHITVKDDGIGIAPDRLESIFDAFTQADTSTTRKYGGTGLGLAIVRELVELLGGSVTLESVLGKGTTFGFSIEAPAVLAKSLKIGPYRCGIHLREPEERTALTEILENLGASVQDLSNTAYNASDIDVVITDNYQCQHPVPHLYIVDYLAPRGDGRRKEVRRPLRRATMYSALESILSEERRPAPRRHSSAIIERSSSTTGDTELRVLVVDDNPVNRMMTCKMLRRMGYQAEDCTNGVEAIDKVSTGRFAIVLMDCQMPVMDGFEATRNIRSRQMPVQPVIVALTADAFAQTHVACLDSGMDDCLTKPISVAELQEGVERAITVFRATHYRRPES